MDHKIATVEWTLQQEITEAQKFLYELDKKNNEFKAEYDAKNELFQKSYAACVLAFSKANATGRELNNALTTQTQLIKKALDAEGPDGMPAARTRGKRKSREQAMMVAEKRALQAKAPDEEASLTADCLYDKLKIEQADTEILFDKLHKNKLLFLAGKEADFGRLFPDVFPSA